MLNTNPEEVVDNIVESEAPDHGASEEPPGTPALAWVPLSQTHSYGAAHREVIEVGVSVPREALLQEILNIRIKFQIRLRERNINSGISQFTFIVYVMAMNSSRRRQLSL